MKTAIILLAAICISLGLAAQPAFTGVSMAVQNNHRVLKFAVPRDINTRHYRIEASNDDHQFEVIATLPSRGQGMLPASYSYDVTLYAYTYYRVARVDMNGQMPCSEVVGGQRTLPKKESPAGDFPFTNTQYSAMK